ncbi:hypothetical protein [Methylobacterium iners]|uniref:Uncharacterized protein n=1 Tax=Methylobacterium iners TaxID=418707 RepID=A0ABQ4RVC7_9HYPH|nr:hypothetical protein [Methylobacterium iners]GJD94791.1 hypothetical protein OCOJLMKI_1995 [Methylobacterium iners]
MRSKYPERLENVPSIPGVDLTKFMHVVQDMETGLVYASDHGGPYERAHAFITQMVTGKPYRDPGPLNPLTADPSEVASMLEYLVIEFRPDLEDHPRLGRACEALAGNMGSSNNQKVLGDCETNYDRWDIMLETAIGGLDRK